MVPHFTPAVHRLFTPAEADGLLAAVLPQLDELAACVGRAREVMAGPVTTDSRVELLRLQERAQALVDALRGLGMRVRDLEPLSVAFPAQFKGQRALLYWKQGEERVCRWSRGEDGSRSEPLSNTDTADWLYFS